jgi:uncharacterized delta-60 repeat protein
MRRLVVSLTTIGSLGLLGFWSASASVPYPLDPSFGNTAPGYSVVAPNLGATEDEPFDLIQLPDGKFLASGKSWAGPARRNDFTIVKWNANGTPDTTFGTGGWTRFDFSGGEDGAVDLVAQPAGKVLLAGEAGNSVNASKDFALARINANGSLDMTFATYGAPGLATVDFTGGRDEALGMVVLADGKIMLGGYATINGKRDFALVRFSEDGSLDTTFGWAGRVATDVSGGDDQIMRLQLQPDGKIVAAGITNNAQGTNMDFAVARYLPNGALDTTFSPLGKAGVETIDFNGLDDIAYAVALRYDGKILISGLARTTTTDFDGALAQLNIDGTIDTTFAVWGKPGVVTTDFSGGYDQHITLAIQPDGKILAGGHAVTPGTGFDFAVARYLPNGDLDTSFGIGGKISTDIYGGPDGIHAIVLTAEGKMVAAGDLYNPYTLGDDIILAAYLVADPSYIRGFVYTMPVATFGSTAIRIATLIALNEIVNDVANNNNAAALTKLQTLRTHLDGCGASADANDWITNCAQQTIVRAQVDQVIEKID